ncbi:FG-GAP repeat domain-containing protein [Rhodococcus sp. NPDC127528]|uniref:FG-GAP repeat domain-containing protein n=1 Tax=unclassified Rhodococcus (in: high G+C Gram-positive bacteria) TaxID=192944 RepID=UPI003644482A
MSNPDAYTDADLAEYEAELTDIAADPNLSPDEKLDAIEDAVSAEIDEIMGAAPTSTPSSTTNTASTDTESADTADTAPEETTVTEPTATVEDLNSVGADAPAGSDVVGDPATASYGTATPDAVAEPVSEPAAATTQPASTPTGLEGNVDYYSPRDVDRDGNVDVIHARVDGVDTIAHVDDEGNVTLVEQDTDHNGTYETATAVRADGTVRIAEDTDDDGDVDLVTYHAPATGQPVRQDEIDGARITASQFDTDGDGRPDVHLVDSNGDGRFDTVAVDTDGDGVVNATLIDTDGDGKFDLVTSDNDNDGSQESYLTSGENGVGSLGDISTYESLIPADDSYHTQAGADTYEPPVVDELPADLA